MATAEVEEVTLILRAQLEDDEPTVEQDCE